MPKSYRETAEFVIDKLKSLGLDPNPSSRFMKMYRVVAGSRPSIPATDPDFQIALEARRDMTVLALILEQEHAKEAVDGFLGKLSLACNDSVLPQDDREESPGRNAQFELFVAAICQAAGLFPVEYSEPDIRCTLEGMRVGIAAKRIKSDKQIEKRIRKASEQIQKSGLPGFIALDTSIAMNPDNKRIGTVIPEEEFAQRYSDAMNASVANYVHILKNFNDRDLVIGCIVHDQQILLFPDLVWGLTGMTTVVPIAASAEATALFSKFWSRYSNGLPDVEHL
ncbi:MAG: hypothetical protein IIB38_11295 [Candidatus Hydrogenedentes bacterium]|nr:hypothetical protein [Candidatus Hydrogenedentota bacterium]